VDIQRLTRREVIRLTSSLFGKSHIVPDPPVYNIALGLVNFKSQKGILKYDKE